MIVIVIRVLPTTVDSMELSSHVLYSDLMGCCYNLRDELILFVVVVVACAKIAIAIAAARVRLGCRV